MFGRISEIVIESTEPSGLAIEETKDDALKGECVEVVSFFLFVFLFQNFHVCFYVPLLLY